MRRYINETLSMDSAIIQSKSNWKEVQVHTKTDKTTGKHKFNPFIAKGGESQNSTNVSEISFSIKYSKTNDSSAEEVSFEW